jgi:hypothetical protein
MRQEKELTKEHVMSIIGKAFIATEIYTIDPGRSNGCIARYKPDDPLIIKTWPMSKINNFEVLVDFLRYEASICKLPIVFLERITTFAGDYKPRYFNSNQPISVKEYKEEIAKRNAYIGRAFQLNKLKDHYVELRSAVKLSKMQFIEVMPRTWQTYIGVYQHNEEHTQRKKRYVDIARRYYPQVNVVGWNADALLMVEFAKRKLKYDQRWVLNELKKMQHKTQITFKT